MVIIKIVGLFFLTMAMLVAGYFIGYTERKYEDDHDFWKGGEDE